MDLRDESSVVEKLTKNRQKPITFDQGERLAKELKAVKYVECSALTQVCFEHLSNLIVWKRCFTLPLY